MALPEEPIVIALDLIEIEGEVGVVYPDALLARLGIGPDNTITPLRVPANR